MRSKDAMWCVEVIFQQRGSEEESSEYAAFESRDDAEGVVEKLKADVAKAAPDEFITLSAPRRRIDFLKQDFRRVRVFERKRRGA
jgi:hypothetical protein